MSRLYIYIYIGVSVSRFQVTCTCEVYKKREMSLLVFCKGENKDDGFIFE